MNLPIEIYIPNFYTETYAYDPFLSWLTLAVIIGAGIGWSWILIWLWQGIKWFDRKLYKWL